MLGDPMPAPTDGAETVARSVSPAPGDAPAEPPAQPGEFAPIDIGPLRVWPPVVLAPMAGVTNYPFRRLCRSFGAGLYVSEMITARALVEENQKSLKLADFGPDESPRSLQVYGVDPHYVGEAVRRLVGEGKVDHIDMNFGCPVRKVTRKGGGAAVPARPRLLARIVRAAVGAAGKVPVTLKFRMGIDDSLRTDLDAGKVAEGEGCVAVGLHARTAAQLYDGHARWEAIGELKRALKIPVLGNGDIWEASDALRMMRQTGCDGVIVGRGCLGRPWLFRELADVFDGNPARQPPLLGVVIEVMLQHARWTAEWFGEPQALRAFRRQAAWYTKGFKGSARLRQALNHVSTLDELAAAVGDCNPSEPFPKAALRVSRGKHSGTQQVSLPEGFLGTLDDDSVPVGADDAGEDGGDGG
ncbi:MAG TPA: tRNA dihydrouridine synthase DusB [Polyangiaceae bacterium]|nr:tRNA dihydrouridine synthase DusB [Polyangiaceae bacterium]